MCNTDSCKDMNRLKLYQHFTLYVESSTHNSLHVEAQGDAG